MGSVDRTPYETATTLTQAFLDECGGNLTCKLELIVDVEAPDSTTLRLSDRNKYVGSTFYQARLVFPVISRTIGELLSPELQFSDQTLEINNADGKFNHLMPSGADYSSWIGKRVTIKLGLRDVASTYKTIFSGTVTPEGGFQRTVKSFILVARSDFEKLNVSFPKEVFSKTAYPNISADLENFTVPVIYGDWTVEVEPNAASILAYPVNSLDPDVSGDSSPHSTNPQLVIANNDLLLFDATQVYLKRGDLFVNFDPADVVNVGAGNRSFELRQSGTTPAGVTLVDGAPFDLADGDIFLVKVKGKDLGAYGDNGVSQAMDMLETYAGALSGDFTSAWTTYRDKASPAQSAVANFKCRIWVQEAQPVLTYALSLLEQLRLEAFVDRDGKLGMSSLHFEDFVAAPTVKLKNWDIEEGSFKPKIDERTNFNRAQGSFNFLPNRNENFRLTKVLKNDAAITAAGKAISKSVVYPNLYVEADVTYNLTELLRLCSAFLELVELTATWRAILQDLGGFVALDVDVQATEFANVPALIRKIGYDPEGLKVPIEVFSMQTCPFPGYAGAGSGITGGYAAVITEE